MSFVKYCVIYKEFTPTIVLNGSNLNCTYMTSLRSFPHFWDPQIESQPYIQDFLEKLSSFFGIHKSNPNRTYKTSLRRFPHFFWDPQIKSQPYIQDFLEKLSSFFGIHKSNPNRTYKTFLKNFPHLWDPITNQIATVHTRLS